MLTPQDFRGITQIEATGRFLQYLECTSATRADVVLWVDGQPVGTMLPGMAYELDEQCRRWELYPVDPACSGRVVIGDGRMTNGRIVGPIEVRDRAAASVLAGVEAWAGWQRTPGAGTYSSIGLIATTRPLIVRSMVVVHNTGAYINRYTGGLSTSPVQTRPGVGKISSQPAPTGVMHIQDTNSSFQVLGLNFVLTIELVLNNLQQQINTTPVVLLPGESIWAQHLNLVSPLGVRFEWSEAP